MALSAFLFVWSTSQAETVKLRITYNGAGVANSEITIKHGDAALGSGRTDGDGNVRISAGMLASKSIDVYGHKTCGGAEKNWDVKGWVVLDDDNFYHLKMEEVVKEMSGMGMPESMLVSAWGLTASGCNDGGGSSASSEKASTSSSGDNASDGGGSSTNSSSGTTNFDLLREEKLKMQQDGLENEIAMYNNRISKKTVKVEDLEDTGATEIEIRRAQIDLEIDKLRREKKELDLEEIEAKLDGPGLDRARRGEVRDRRDEIKVEIEKYQEEDKKLKAAAKEAKKDQKFETMGKADLKKHLLDMKANRKTKKITLKMKSRSMKPERKKELEKEIEILDATIEKYQERLDELQAEE